MKSAVLVIILAAARHVLAESRSGYGYLDVTLHVLKWIAYLKRLSLIALILCAAVLYYVPKSRSYALRTCCIWIDFIANGLKSVLSVTEIKYGHVIAGNQDDKNKRSGIQKQRPKLFSENINDYGQRKNKTNINDHRSKNVNKEYRRDQEKRKSCAKRSFEEEHERHRLHSHHHRNASIKDVLESGAMIIPPVNSLQQLEMINKKCERDKVITPRDPALNIKCHMMTDNMKNNTNLQEERLIETDYSLKNTKTESFLFTKAGLEITNENSVSSTILHKNDEHPDRSCPINKQSIRSSMTQISDDLETVNCIYSSNKELEISTCMERQDMNATDIDKTGKNLRKRQHLNDTKHEKVQNTSQYHSSETCTSSIMSKQLADPYYGETLTTYESVGRLQRENHRLFLSMKKIVDDCCYENAPIIKNRAKPGLLRVLNWLFGGCPAASRREMLEKEESLECTNVWLH